MKTILYFVFLFSAYVAQGQSTNELKVVMAMNKGDSTNQRWLVRQLYNLKIALPEANVEVVCYGSGLQTLIESSCRIKEDIQKLMNKGIVFAACENSMAGAGITKEQLVPMCSTVKAGIAELILKQSAGWQYVDASR